MKVKQMYMETKTIAPKIIYSSKAFARMITFINTTHAKTKEFMFLGLVSKEGYNYVVSDFMLVPQHKCSQVYCESDDDRYPEWLAKTIDIKDRKLIRLHGHHHVNMGTKPSGTDDQQIEDLCKNVSDYYIQLIINNKLENTVNIWDKKQHLIFEDVDQYIKIGEILIKLKNINNYEIYKMDLQSKDISTSDDGMLCIGNNAVLIPEENTLVLLDKNISIILKINSTLAQVVLQNDKELVKEANAEMNKMIKNNITYQYPSPGLGGYDYYGNKYSDYFTESELEALKEEAGYPLEDIQKANTPKKRGRKPNESK